MLSRKQIAGKPNLFLSREDKQRIGFVVYWPPQNILSFEGSVTNMKVLRNVVSIAFSKALTQSDNIVVTRLDKEGRIMIEWLYSYYDIPVTEIVKGKIQGKYTVRVPDGSLAFPFKFRGISIEPAPDGYVLKYHDLVNSKWVVFFSYKTEQINPKIEEIILKGSLVHIALKAAAPLIRPPKEPSPLEVVETIMSTADVSELVKTRPEVIASLPKLFTEIVRREVRIENDRFWLFGHPIEELLRKFSRDTAENLLRYLLEKRVMNHAKAELGMASVDFLDTELSYRFGEELDVSLYDTITYTELLKTAAKAVLNTYFRSEYTSPINVVDYIPEKREFASIIYVPSAYAYLLAKGVCREEGGYVVCPANRAKTVKWAVSYPDKAFTSALSEHKDKAVEYAVEAFISEYVRADAEALSMIKEVLTDALKQWVDMNKSVRIRIPDPEQLSNVSIEPLDNNADEITSFMFSLLRTVISFAHNVSLIS